MSRTTEGTHFGLERFQNQQRVRVSDPRHPLVGEVGTVWRLRMADDCAWVQMDRELPPDLLTFPRGDHRDRHILLYPHECLAATPTE